MTTPPTPPGSPWGPYPPPPPLPSQGLPPWQGPGTWQGPAPAGVPRPEPALRDSSRVVDLLVALALVVFVTLPSLATASVSGNAVGVFFGVVASFVMPAALYWRRTRPVASAVVVYAAALLHFLAGSPVIVADVLIFVALYSVTVYGPVWAGRTALGGALFGALLMGAWLAGTPGPGFAGDIYNLTFSLDSIVLIAMTGGLIGAVCLFVWAMGLVRRSRLAHTETLAERARRLEVERDQQAQIATAAERSRIAREMHDVVAHSLSVVIAQADGGRYAAAADPDAAVRALTTIADTGRAALADMRKILGVLRAPGSEGEGHGETMPQPIDADLDTLVEQVRGSGLDVSLVRVGQARQLPPGLGLTVYRICQEALTNVLKHGGPTASATVLIHWAPQRIVVQVEDTGRGAAATSDGAGHGLLGMRERVTLFGGTLETGAKPGGGYRVRAEIPLPGAVPFVLPPPPDGSAAPLAPASWPRPQQNGTP